MITVNPIKLNNNIAFKENRLHDMTPNVAILPLQNPNAGINFQKEFERSTKADAVQSSMLPALAYKFVKTYNILFSPKRNEPVQNNAEKHINYAA